MKTGPNFVYASSSFKPNFVFTRRTNNNKICLQFARKLDEQHDMLYVRMCTLCRANAIHLLVKDRCIIPTRSFDCFILQYPRPVTQLLTNSATFWPMFCSLVALERDCYEIFLRGPSQPQDELGMKCFI